MKKSMGYFRLSFFALIFLIPPVPAFSNTVIKTDSTNSSLVDGFNFCYSYVPNKDEMLADIGTVVLVDTAMSQVIDLGTPMGKAVFRDFSKIFSVIYKADKKIQVGGTRYNFDISNVASQFTKTGVKGALIATAALVFKGEQEKIEFVAKIANFLGDIPSEMVINIGKQRQDYLRKNNLEDDMPLNFAKHDVAYNNSMEEVDTTTWEGSFKKTWISGEYYKNCSRDLFTETLPQFTDFVFQNYFPEDLKNELKLATFKIFPKLAVGNFVDYIAFKKLGITTLVSNFVLGPLSRIFGSTFAANKISANAGLVSSHRVLRYGIGVPFAIATEILRISAVQVATTYILATSSRITMETSGLVYKYLFADAAPQNSTKTDL